VHEQLYTYVMYTLSMYMYLFTYLVYIYTHNQTYSVANISGYLNGKLYWHCQECSNNLWPRCSTLAMLQW